MFDENLLPKHLDNMTSMLTSLVNAAAEFASA